MGDGWNSVFSFYCKQTFSVWKRFYLFIYSSDWAERCCRKDVGEERKKKKNVAKASSERAGKIEESEKFSQKQIQT